MNDERDYNNYLGYRFKDSHLEKCNQLLEAQLIKMWWYETESLCCLKACADKMESSFLNAIIEQFQYEGALQVERLRKVSEVLKLDMDRVIFTAREEITRLMKAAQSAIMECSGDDLAGRWKLVLELEKLILDKMAYYQSMVSWSKSLRLYGIQELLEDSLDEYEHQDLLLNFLSETWSA